MSIKEKEIIILNDYVSKQIKGAILRSGMTLDTLKEGTGISKSKLSRLQNGKMKFVERSVIEKLSDYLKVKIYIPSNEVTLAKKIVELENENRQLKELLLNYIDGKERDML